jgi:hypothetical protein
VLLESSSSGDGHAVPGSPEAVQRLFAAGLPVRFLTNESQCTRRLLWEKLNRLGYSLSGEKDQDNFSLPRSAANPDSHQSLKLDRIRSQNSGAVEAQNGALTIIFKAWNSKKELRRSVDQW